MRLSILLIFLATAAFALDIGITWDNNDPSEQVERYYLYQAFSVTGPYQNMTNSATNMVRVIVPSNGMYFFFVTASNFWGESSPSNTNTTPKNTGKVNNPKISR